jgi:hypothetical protein
VSSTARCWTSPTASSASARSARRPASIPQQHGRSSGTGARSGGGEAANATSASHHQTPPNSSYYRRPRADPVRPEGRLGKRPALSPRRELWAATAATHGQTTLEQASRLTPASRPFHKPGAGCTACPRCWRSRRTAISWSYPIEQTPTSGCICNSTPTTRLLRDPGGSPFARESGCARPRERRAVGARPWRKSRQPASGCSERQAFRQSDRVVAGCRY